MSNPKDGASIVEAEALVELLMTAEVAGGPKTHRGAMNVLLLAAAVLLNDHTAKVLGYRAVVFDALEKTKNVLATHVLAVPALRRDRAEKEAAEQGKPH